MTSRKAASKQKKGFVFHDIAPILEGEDNAGPSTVPGYQEVHQVFNQRGGEVESSASSIYIPPSPVKGSHSTGGKRVRSPSPTPYRQPQAQTAQSTYDDSNLPGLPEDLPDHTHQSMWTEDPDKQEEETAESSDGPRKKKRRRGPEKNPLNIFTKHIDRMIDELLRLEGPGSSTLACSRCSNTQADSFYRCRDCSTPELWCRDCLLSSHQTNYVHRIQIWTGNSFEDTSLKNLGLRIQLVHPLGEKCPHPRPAINDDFVIIDSDGIHEVALDYCGCQRTCAPAVQLLRSRLFPATTIDPRTAASFRVLESFQMLSFTAKTSAYEYLASIRRRTDNTGGRDVPDRYREFMRMVHEWRHLRMLKRAGRGHDPSGVKGTKEGECVVLCPACPLPGINLPEGWNLSDEVWVHALFLAIDANFRLTRKVSSNEAEDPGLNHGYAYIVEEKKFKEYLAMFGKVIPDDKSTCNNHDAIKSASIRGGKGLAASGLGIVQCSRHDMKRPCGCGDTQKGERYVNMDYFCIQTLLHNIPLKLVISYDIVCQWSINFVSRCLKYPPNPIGGNPALSIKYLVPKFHLAAHIESCRVNYSFNLAKHVGRTDGEAPERGWSGSNDLAYSTREMGPGSRRDTLDDCFGDTNWDKATRMSGALMARAKEAMVNRKEHVDAWISFADTIPERLVRKWTRRVKAWEDDQSKPNPFETDGGAITESAVRHRLAKEDEASIQAGEITTVHSVVTPSVFVLQALGLEEAIRKHLISVRDLGLHPTDLQEAALLEESNLLRRRFESWEKLQSVYMPTVVAHRQSLGEEAGAATGSVRDIRLFLPSEMVGRVQVPDRLANHEFQYRLAQAHTTLRDLKEGIIVRTHMINSKKKYSHGTSQMTRSNAKIQSTSQSIRDIAAKYQTIRLKLVALSSVGCDTLWMETLKELDDGDIRGLTSQEIGDGGRRQQLGEGYRKLTWIWNVVQPRRVEPRRGRQGRVYVEGDDDEDVGSETDSDSESEGEEVNSRRATGKGKQAKQVDKRHRYRQDDPALRIEFCRTRARAHRWQEECILLGEELSRVERFWSWDADRWEARAIGHSGQQEILEDDAFPELVERSKEAAELLSDGKRAYACRQAVIRRDLEKRARENWAAVYDALMMFGEGDQMQDGRVMVECTRPRARAK